MDGNTESKPYAMLLCVVSPAALGFSLRDMKKRTNYFSHDSNARNDEKLINLRMKLGAAGYAVYFMILERLRDEADYTSAKDYKMIDFDLRAGESLIKSVVEDFGLFEFTDDERSFYSPSFKRRMGEKDAVTKALSDAGKRGNEKRWGGNRVAIQNVSGGDSKATEKVSQESKEKEKEDKKENSLIRESKKEGEKDIAAHAAELLEKRKQNFYNDLIPYVAKYGREMVREFFDYWTEPNRSNTQMRFELQRTWALPLRLAYWAKKDNNFNSRNNGNNRSTAEQRAAEVASLIERKLSEDGAD